MAARMTVEDSKFLPHLFQQIDKNRDANTPISSPQSLLVSINGTPCVWDENKNVLYLGSSNQVKTLLCSEPPFYHVQSLLVNSDNDQVALIGSRGVSILHLPASRSLDSPTKSGKKQQLCQTSSIDNYYFSNHRKESVLKVLWHPGSPNGSHICVLTSDGMLRIYNTAKPEVPHKVLKLTDNSSKFSSALGDNFVSMSFGHKIQSGGSALWPLYLLTGCGSVFVVNTSLWPSSQPPEVFGPMKMLPAAEDNYGSDACDILCLDSESDPQVLVISTVDGTLTHCILLDGESEDSDDEGASSLGTTASGGVLYVYDIVHLDLMLSNNRYDEYTTPILLIRDKDSQFSSNYYCIHSAGAHFIELPWLANMSFFTNNERNGDTWLNKLEDEQTVSTHIVCTKPLPSNKAAPVRGLLVKSIGLHTDEVLCLLSDFTCLKLTIRSSSLGESLTLLSSTSTPGAAAAVCNRKPFIQHIKEILQKSANNPLIKASEGGDQLTAEQQYNLLCRSTQIFREEYINKLEIAKDELDRRVRSLNALKQQQFADMAALQQQKVELTEEAESLAERYEDINDKNNQLTSRMESVMSRIQKTIKGMSAAEQEFSEQLEQRDAQLKDFQSKLEQIKKKQKHLKEQKSEKKTPKPCLSDSQLKSVNMLLAEEADKIEDLVHQLKVLKTASS